MKQPRQVTKKKVWYHKKKKYNSLFNKDFQKQNEVLQISSYAHLTTEVQGAIEEFMKENKKFVDYTIHCSEEQLLWSNSVNDWNIKMITGHLIHYLEYQAKVIQAFLEKKGPFEASFDPKEAFEKEEFNNRSFENLLARFNENKQNICLILSKTETGHWEQDASLILNSRKITLSSLISEITNYQVKMTEMVFMNLQRFKPWHIREEEKG